MRLARRATEWVAVTILSMPLGLLYSVVLARALGPAARGEYATFVTAAGMLVGLLSMGAGVVGRADVAADRGRVRAVHSNLLWFASMAGLLVLAGAGVHAFVLPSGQPAWLGVPLAVCVGAGIYSGYGILLLQGIGEFRLVNMLRIGRTGSDVVLAGFFLVLLSFGLPGAVWGWTSGTLIIAIITYSMLVRIGGSPVQFNLTEFKVSIRHGWHILVAGQAIALQTSIAILVLARYASAADVGVFAIALGLSVQVASLCSTLAVVASDRIAGPHRGASEDVVKRLTRLLIAMAIPMLVGAWLTADHVIVALYGEEYRRSAMLFLMLLCGHLISQVTEVDAQFLIGQHWKTVDAMGLNVVNMAIGFVLVFTLIPRFGAQGAAISLSSAYVLNALSHHIWVKRTMRCAWHDLLFLKRADIARVLSAIDFRARTAST